MRFKQVRAQMNEELAAEFRQQQQYRNSPGAMSREEYEEKQQEIHWDVAWQIFDEINEHNDVERFIDLSALTLDDCLAITKQKIYDLAQIAEKEFNKDQTRPQDLVLVVKCDEGHLVDIGGLLKNGVLEMTKNELNLDCHYIPDELTLFARITEDTINHPVLREW